MKNHCFVVRSLVLVLIAVWLTGTLQVQGSSLNKKLPPSISGQTSVSAATALGTAFTYQGLLKDGSGNPVTNTCGFQFGLYDVLSGGSLVTGTTLQTITPVTVTNGYFTVSLDFGASAFNGSARWLQIAVSCPTSVSYTTLTPRQPLTAAPYALYSVKADLLDGKHASAFQQHYKNVLVVAHGNSNRSIVMALDKLTKEQVLALREK